MLDLYTSTHLTHLLSFASFGWRTNALAFTRGARTKPSATQSRHEGRFTQAGAVGVQRLVGWLRA